VALSRPPPQVAPNLTLPATTGAELTLLAEKYDRLTALRHAKRRGEPDAARQVYKRLATEFPGALNELDTLTLRELGDRARALHRAAEGGELEPWMAWSDAYHRLMRAALLVKPLSPDEIWTALFPRRRATRSPDRTFVDDVPDDGTQV